MWFWILIILIVVMLLYNNQKDKFKIWADKWGGNKQCLFNTIRVLWSEDDLVYISRLSDRVQKRVAEQVEKYNC